MISLRNLSYLYDMLYEQADRAIKAYKLCQFKNGMCTRDRREGGLSKNGCCSQKPCDYLGPEGCKVESLKCKTFMCEHLKYNCNVSPAFKARVRCCQMILETIENLAQKIFDVDGYTPLGYFRSKEEVLEEVRKLRRHAKKKV